MEQNPETTQRLRIALTLVPLVPGLVGSFWIIGAMLFFAITRGHALSAAGTFALAPEGAHVASWALLLPIVASAVAFALSAAFFLREFHVRVQGGQIGIVVYHFACLSGVGLTGVLVCLHAAHVL